MRKFAAALFLWLVCLTGAIALTQNQEVPLLGGGAQAAAYTDFTQLSALPPSLYNFTGGTAGASTCTNASGVIVIQTGPCFDHTPAGTPLGLRTWHAVTNLYLNSNAPATQTVAVANATQYTISFWGTGTLTLAGACTQVIVGSAGVLTSYTCTSATTSLVATDSGLTSTAYPQVEAFAYAGPRCVTGTSSATCTQDVPSLTGPTLAAMQGKSGAIIIEAFTPSNPNNLVSIADSGYNFYISNSNGAGANSEFGVKNVSNLLLKSGTWYTGARVGVSWLGTASLFSGNGSAPTTSVYVAPSGNIYLGSNGSATPLDGYIRRDAFYTQSLSSATLQKFTVPTARLH